MRPGRDNSSLLSASQIDELRSQVKVKREALFVAPQLLEQVIVLTRDLRETVAALHALREATLQLATLQERLAPASSQCPACNDTKVREAWAQLKKVLGETAGDTGE